MEYDQEFYQALVFVIAHALAVLFGLGYVISGLIGSGKNPDLNPGELNMDRLHCYKIRFSADGRETVTYFGAQNQEKLDSIVENVRCYLDPESKESSRVYLGLHTEEEFGGIYGFPLGHYKVFRKRRSG